MAVVYGDDISCGIQKRIFHAGKGDVPDFVDGTKVKFHYQTRKCDDEKTILDDSKKDNGKPLELYLGKKFKLEVWETCLKSMRLHEVASFVVDRTHAAVYPLVAKNLRDIRQGKTTGPSGHCCGLTIKEHGLGYPDLDELMKDPQSLEFILDLQQVELPGEYKKETWTMNENEKLEAVPRLREEGNALYKEKKYTEAAETYGKAIGMLEQLLIREKPRDEPWMKLDMMKIPFLLNYAQCKLIEKDYYAVIEHTSEVIKKDPENVKALFRRAKAHVGAWNPTEAKDDFKEVARLDPSLQKAVQKELKSLEETERQKDQEDQAKLKGKLFEQH